MCRLWRWCNMPETGAVFILWTAILPCPAQGAPAVLPAATFAPGPVGLASASRPVPGLVAVSPCAIARPQLAARNAAVSTGRSFMSALRLKRRLHQFNDLRGAPFRDRA